MFRFVVDEYPKQWPEERWPEDARSMAEAGFNVARLAKFAWSFLDPPPGCFDFGKFSDALYVFHQMGLMKNQLREF